MIEPKRPLSRDRILNKAIEMADADGLAAISMRKVAAHLSVEAMSLYNHVKNKGDMIDGMTDHIAGQITLPTPDFDWKGEMRNRSQSAHKVLLRHPWAVTEFLQPRVPGPNMMTYLDASLGCLIAVGFSPFQADLARITIDNHIYGFTRHQLARPRRAREFARTARAEAKQIPQHTYPHLHKRTLALANSTPAERDDFDFGLTLILDGLENLL